MSIERLREHPVLRYALAVIAAGATIAALIPLRFLVEPLPSPPFLLMVMVVAWLAGFGPAIVSVIISALALDYWFVPPLGALVTTWHEAASVVSFIAIGTGVAWLTATRRQVEDDRQALLVRERASRASAEAANRAKDEFVAMLGHEFRNPLSAIVSAVQILERVGTQDDASRHARDVVARQAKNITRMVEDLLEINRIATGKIRLDLQRVELADMVRHCLATLAGRASAHRVSLEAAEVWVDADPVRLEQIVVNLLDNAVKYTPAGGAIHVRVSREGTHAVLRVRDTGVGIEPDVLPRIFDLFVQGEPGAIRGRRERPGPARNPALATRDVGARGQRYGRWSRGVRDRVAHATRRHADRRRSRRLRRLRARAAPAHGAGGQGHAARRAHRVGTRGRHRPRAGGRIRPARDQAARRRRAGRNSRALR